jgi:membrane associated rhomboid family serine protease
MVERSVLWCHARGPASLFFFVELSGGEAFVNKWALVPSRFLANPSADWPTLFISMFMHGG